MTDMPIILHFFFSGLATVGFAVFFNTPTRLLAPAGITGGIGWIMIQKNYSMSVTKGTDAIFLSAAIALGVLVITSLVRTLNIVRSRQIAERKQRKLAQEAIKAGNSSEINPQIDNQSDYAYSSTEREIETKEYDYEVLNKKSDSNISCYNDDFSQSPSIDFDLDDLEPKPKN